MTKFEQLLDYIVNEEHDKANKLFHEIVVEKSREIYENLIAEEEDEDMDESADEDMDEDEDADADADEDMDEDEDADADEEEDESMDLEDSYMMDGDDDTADDDMDEMGGDATDDLESDISVDSPEEDLKMSIQNAMDELQAAFDAAEEMTGGEKGGDEFATSDDDMDSEKDDMMGFKEGRRMTREYVEKVGNDWDKGGNKQQAKHVGAGTGDTDSASVEGRSPISSGSGKPNTGANAKNLNQSHHEGGSPTGTNPAGKAGGFLSNAKIDNGGNGNVPGGKMGVKNLKKVSGGHGAEKKGSGPGPVGSGTGDKAGQTSMSNQAQLIKHIK
jgi:hypothetical protein